jgi:hypothetical protein
MGKRIAGIAYVKANGDQYPLRGGFTVSPSPTEREGLAGQDYVHGYKELPRVPSISGDISMTPELSLERLQNMTDVTITAELASGHVYVLRNAWTKSAFEINTADGQVAVVWEGLACHELKPA